MIESSFIKSSERIECLRQKIKGLPIPEWSRNGQEDCSVCIYDLENNQKCKDYIQLRSLYLNVHKIENIVEHSQNI